MSLSVKLNIVLSLATLLIVFVFGGYEIYDISRTMQQELHDTLAMVSERLAHALAEPLFTVNIRVMTSVVVSEMNNKEVYAIVVRDQYQDNAIIVGKVRDPDWQVQDLSPETPLPDLFSQVVPIIRDEQELGSVEVYLTEKFMQQQLRAAIVQRAITLIVLLLGITLTLTLLILVSISRPLHALMEKIERITAGEFDQEIPIRRNDEIGRLGKCFVRMRDAIRAVLHETDRLIQAIQAGQLQVRGESDAFSGDWRDLVQGVNDIIDAFVIPFTMTAEAIDRIAIGDIPEPITGEYQGEFNTIKTNLNLLIAAMQEATQIAEEIAWGNLTVTVTERSDQDRLMQALNLMVSQLKTILEEMTDLTQAIQSGRLDARGKPETYAGSWRDLMAGLNNLIEAFVAPITMAAIAIDRIAKGNIPEPLQETARGDFNKIVRNLNCLIEAMQEITGLAEAMAGGNLAVEVNERSSQDTLMQALNAMSAKLQEIVLHVKVAADMVTVGSGEIRQTTNNMSQGVAKQAAASEEASSSMEQMAVNIHQNADNARQTEKIALQSRQYAEESGNVVAETVIAMQQIAKKITIIQEIADQTRMLSLNATIEAARAEDHGKAFSVVASEVRKLSDVTKSAAEEINELASSSLDISEKAAEMLNTLVPNIQKTAELVQEISAASGEQSIGAEQVNKAIQQLDQITQQNAFTAEQMSSTAEALAMQARQLQEMIAFFRGDEHLEEHQAMKPHKTTVAAEVNTPVMPQNDQESETSELPEENNPDEQRFYLERDDQDDDLERY